MEENDPFAAEQPPEIPVAPPHDELPPSPLGADPASPMTQEPKLASPGKRLLARIVDVLVLIIPIIVLAFILRGFVFNLVAVVLVGAYEVLMISNSGQTVGKKALGIKVVDESTGQIPDIQAAGMRWGVPQILSLIPFVGWIISLVIYLSLLWRDRNQGFHDTVAHTIVVEA